MSGLRWRENYPGPGTWGGFSGDLLVAMVGQRDDGSVWSSISAVNMRWIYKRRGVHVSVEAARRSADRAWAKWLAHAGLTPAASSIPDCDDPNRPPMRVVSGPHRMTKVELPGRKFMPVKGERP